MLLNNNDYSLKTISDKTNISIENLEKLSNKEWDKFKKTQAIGLISIIEREFNEDLSSLKAEAIAYFDEHKEKVLDRPIDLVDAASVAGGGNRIISNIITIITLGAIGYAGWYYFAQDKIKTVNTDSNITLESSDKGMFASTIESVKNLLSSSKDETTKVLKEANSSKNQSVQEQTETASETSTNAPQESKTQEPANSSSAPKKFDITSVPSNSETNANENNNSDETKEVVVIVNPENKANSQEPKAKEQTQEVATQTEAAQEQNSAQQSSAELSQSSNSEVNDSNTDKTEVGKLLNELDNNSSQKTQEQESVEVNSSNVAQDVNTTQTDTNSSEDVLAITTAQINLKSKKLWLGIYNLSTKKRTVKLIKKPLDLEVGNSEYAIVSGHNKFEIVTNSGVKKFTKKGRVYFKISKDGIEELTKQEYKVLTKKRAW